MNNKENATEPLRAATGSADRDGNWLDKWGACKVCDGEIPHGHANNCDIYKMECQIRVMRSALEEVLSHRKEDKDGNYVMWIGEGTFLKCEAALNPPNDD